MGLVVNWFRGWFNICMGKGGAYTLVEMLYKLFKGVGVPETMTSDGSQDFKS